MQICIRCFPIHVDIDINLALLSILLTFTLEKEVELDVGDPINNFLYALEAPRSRQKYPTRLKMFFDWGLEPKFT